MTEKEMKLINIIREQDNPEQALTLAIEIILNYLEQQRSSEEQAPVVLRELV